jgi:hypothetical protein
MELLARNFGEYVLAFDDDPAFVKSGQRENHLRTMQLRFELGSASAAIDNSAFLHSLRITLLSWGIGSRGSVLVTPDEFAAAIRGHASAIIELEQDRLDDPSLRRQAVAEKAWALIKSLGIARNDATLVPCSKALHHLLPELIVPMDREYTRTFFGWHGQEFQYQQERIFRHAFDRFVTLAATVNPRQFIRPGWQTSVSKIIDNALVAFCRVEKLKRPS